MPRLSPLELEGLRSSVGPEYGGARDEDLEQIVESAMSELAADTAEDFMKALGSFGKTVGSTVQRAAPGIAQGAATGATVGGPWGALIGAGAGLASGVLRGKGRPAAPPAPAAPTSVPPPVPGAVETSAPLALPTGQGAAATLLGILQSPTVQQALMSQVLGAAGSQEIPTPSGTSVPRAAINSLLTQLLANASESLVESESTSEQSYLQDDSGEYLIDPASPEQQAALVLSRLAPARLARFRADSGEAGESEAADSMEAAEWMGEELADSESEDWVAFEEGAEVARFY